MRRRESETADVSLTPARPIVRVTLAALLASVALLHAETAGGSAVSASRQRLPEIIAQTIEGKPFRLSALRGQVVVLDFLIPECPECKSEAPVLEAAAADYARRGVRFVIVDLSNADRKLVRDYYRAKLGLRRVTVVLDRRFRIGRAYNILVLGTTLVVGRDGSIVWKGSWLGDEERLFRAIEKAL